MKEKLWDVVGVRFKEVGKVYNFTMAGIDITDGDYVIVETVRGVELGEVVLGPKQMKENPEIPFKDVIRKATDEDIEKHKENAKEADKALMICKDKIEEHKLEMRLIDSEYTFDRNKLIFYFTAEGRVDFRELVRDLASIFRTRIELRQIGVRDEAKVYGGIGSCGLEVCCKSFLGEFEPVSIKMAKDQGLSLNPNNISGVCGRLICCLNYEDCVYQEKLEKLPEVGRIIATPSGRGTVLNVDILAERIKARVKLEDGTDNIMSFLLEEIELTEKKDKKHRCRNTGEEIKKTSKK